MSETLYHVSANPHVRDNGSTQKIMLDVIIALLPATIFGIYIFGASAALTVAISVATCVVVEYIYHQEHHSGCRSLVESSRSSL